MENTKVYRASICQIAELVEITTLQDLCKHQKVYICANALCPVPSGTCETVVRKDTKGVQIPLKCY